MKENLFSKLFDAVFFAMGWAALMLLSAISWVISLVVYFISVFIMFLAFSLARIVFYVTGKQL